MWDQGNKRGTPCPLFEFRGNLERAPSMGVSYVRSYTNYRSDNFSKNIGATWEHLLAPFRRCCLYYYVIIIFLAVGTKLFFVS